MRGTVFQPIDANLDPHPYIVISHPVDGFVLVVNLTDARWDPDCPCILKKGEHEAITKDSAIKYRKAVPLSVAGLQQKLAATSTVFAHPCPEHLLRRIIEGAFHPDSGMFLKHRRTYLE